MRKLYFFFFLTSICMAFGQQPDFARKADPGPPHVDQVPRIWSGEYPPASTQKVSGSANDICSEAISLTVGTTFTCGNTSSNSAAASFPSACLTTSGMGIQQFRTDWYCFNSGSNKTLAIVLNSVTNSTSFTPAIAVFGPYTSCAGGCAASMSGPICDNGLSFQVDSIKILENLSPNAYYMIAIVERRSNPDISGGASVGYCISVQPTNLDDCESTSSGTCPTTCGNLCIFTQSSAPSVGQVSSTCTAKTYSHRIQGSGAASVEDTVEFCYNFTVDTGCTVSFGVVVTVSGCSGPGNLTSANWKIYNTSTCTITNSGTSIPPTAVISASGSYIFCFKYSAACLLHFGTIQYGYGSCVIVGPIVTPVELTRFEVNDEEDGNLLSWQTSSEYNNRHFEIEHSQDGINFTRIGIVNSQSMNGNSNQVLNYLFMDAHPSSGRNYYRLKQVDLDGQFTYSPIAVVNNEPKSFQIISNSLSTSSNPSITFENNSNNDKLNIYVTDYSGKTIYNDHFLAQKGINSYQLPFSNFNKGVYIIYLQKTKNQFISAKFMRL